jgi:protein-tyrosine kinase
MLPAHNSEHENIYLRSLGSGMRAIAITSSNHGEGVSSLSIALVQRHLLARKSTLFVDLGGNQPGQLNVLASPADGNPVDSTEPQLLIGQEDSYALLGIPAPANNKTNLDWRNPGILEGYIGAWLEQFDAVIVDAGSFNRSSPTLVPAERIVGACDATLLVVMAGITTEPTVRSTCDRILSAGGNLAGCVLNERYNPSLKEELLREAARVPEALGKFKKTLLQWIDRNRLLSLEI